MGKKKKKRKKKAKKKKAKKKVKKVPKQATRRIVIDQELEPISDVIGRYVDIASKRKLKEVAERPLPDSMSSVEIDSELEELLGND